MIKWNEVVDIFNKHYNTLYINEKDMLVDLYTRKNKSLNQINVLFSKIQFSLTAPTISSKLKSLNIPVKSRGGIRIKKNPLTNKILKMDSERLKKLTAKQAAKKIGCSVVSFREITRKLNIRYNKQKHLSEEDIKEGCFTKNMKILELGQDKLKNMTTTEIAIHAKCSNTFVVMTLMNKNIKWIKGRRSQSNGQYYGRNNNTPNKEETGRGGLSTCLRKCGEPVHT